MLNSMIYVMTGYKFSNSDLSLISSLKNQGDRAHLRRSGSWIVSLLLIVAGALVLGPTLVSVVIVYFNQLACMANPKSLCLNTQAFLEQDLLYLILGVAILVPGIVMFFLVRRQSTNPGRYSLKTLGV
jgi:uncharacterized membrane protein